MCVHVAGCGKAGVGRPVRSSSGLHLPRTAVPPVASLRGCFGAGVLCTWCCFDSVVVLTTGGIGFRATALASSVCGLCVCEFCHPCRVCSVSVRGGVWPVQAEYSDPLVTAAGVKLNIGETVVVDDVTVKDAKLHTASGLGAVWWRCFSGGGRSPSRAPRFFARVRERVPTVVARGVSCFPLSAVVRMRVHDTTGALRPYPPPVRQSHRIAPTAHWGHPATGCTLLVAQRSCDALPPPPHASRPCGQAPAVADAGAGAGGASAVAASP